MTCLCPTCRQPIAERAPVEALRDVFLSAHEKAFIDELIRIYPRELPPSRVIAAIWGNDPDGGPLSARDIVRVLAMRLRRKLAPTGWTVSKSRGGHGSHGQYRLEPAP